MLTGQMLSGHMLTGQLLTGQMCLVIMDTLLKLSLLSSEHLSAHPIAVIVPLLTDSVGMVLLQSVLTLMFDTLKRKYHDILMQMQSITGTRVDQ